jgi:hypothetical protein
MKNYPLAVAVVALVGLTAQAASAMAPAGATAPLQAAGIPTFLSLDGGATANKLIRRFRIGRNSPF